MSNSIHVYIDGFNLYRRSLQGSEYKWLDIDRLCKYVLNVKRIERIFYFSANVKSLPHDPDMAVRQQIYFRALTTLANVEIVKSHFRSESKYMPISPWIYDSNGVPKKSKVWRMKEKGSDVNLASQVLIDAYENNCSSQFILSADSDLVAPIEIVKNRLKREIGLILPTQRNSKKLKNAVGDNVYHIKSWMLEVSQFPEIVQDEKGNIFKPTRWHKAETPTEVGVSRPATEATGDVRED